MASTLVEQTRSLHAEIAIHKAHCVEELLNPQKGPKLSALQEHRVSARLEKIKENEEKLRRIYNDDDGSRDTELQSIHGRNVLSSFYEKLTEVRNYHKKYPMSREEMELDPDMEVKVATNWTGEEYYGKFVDMHDIYDTYLNMPHFDTDTGKGGKIDYKTFLTTFHHFHNVPKDKKDAEYQKFLQVIFDYLFSVFKRSHPLYDPNRIIALVSNNFDTKWAAESVEGWQVPYPPDIFERFPPISARMKIKQEKKEITVKEEGKTDDNAMDMSTDNEPTNADEEPSDELEDIQMENVEQSDEQKEKADETQSPFYCKVCKKLFKESVFESHIRGKKHRKKQQHLESLKQLAKGIAALEHSIHTLVQVLGPQIQETCSQIEKKQTRTFEEILAELEAMDVIETGNEEIVEDEDDENYTGGVYNPLKIPEGWDGKPIPYWLYKFHGLNLEFKCEICSNNSYWGPRAFNRHFREWRHHHGMKSLGIPNTKHFHNITLIEDAKQLYRKLQMAKEKEAFNPQQEEEFEDPEGNVFGKQTYDALKRQGVI